MATRWLTMLITATVLTACAPGRDDVAGPAPDPNLGPVAAIEAVTVQDGRLVRGGRPWWFAGYNSFVWSGDCGTPTEKMSAAQVDQWFASMRHDGHGLVRLFFFEGWDLRRLEAAVASARRHGVQLALTLDDARGDCGETEKNAAWFADPAERAAYARHMTDLLARYRGDPVVAWFEYLNEPDGANGALRAFYDEMGAVADTVDPTRLFSSGTLAPYAVGGEDEFRRVHESPGVDIASLHEYDENEVESNQGPAARRASAGKPVVVGEFGITAGAGCPVGFAQRALRVRAKLGVYTRGGYAGALAWAWQPGGGTTCDLGNLDEDRATQAVLREAGAAP